MKVGLSALKKLLAEKVFVVGVVILFIFSGVIAIVGEKLSGDGLMEEQEVDDGLRCVTDIGRVGGETSHGKWMGGRDGGYKGDNVTHYEEDEFGGSWFDDFEDGSGVEGIENLSLINGGVRLVKEFILDDSCVGLWHFDEGGGNTARDSSWNGNDGTVNGAGWCDGVYGRGMEFDGVDDHVGIISAPEWNFGLNDFTLEL